MAEFPGEDVHVEQRFWNIFPPWQGVDPSP